MGDDNSADVDGEDKEPFDVRLFTASRLIKQEATEVLFVDNIFVYTRLRGILDRLSIYSTSNPFSERVISKEPNHSFRLLPQVPLKVCNCESSSPR